MSENAITPTEPPSDESPSASALPFDVLELVAEHLIARDWHRTCANLSMTSKVVQELIDPILWRRVLYRWDNGSKNSKKAAKWKRVFLSGKAKNIQLGLDSAKYPFLTAILKQPNRLRACIVTGMQRTIGLYLFENYRLCSNDMETVIQLVVEGAQHIPPASDLGISVFRRIEVVLPSDSVPVSYFQGLVSEMLALVRPLAQDYMSCENLKERGLSPRDISLDFFGATISEAMTAGEAVSLAYALDPAFAAVIFRIRTKEPLTQAQMRQYMEIVEKSYFSTHIHFANRMPGAPYIYDESTGSSLDALPTQTMREVTPPGLAGAIGFVQYAKPYNRDLTTGRDSMGPLTATRVIMATDSNNSVAESLAMSAYEEGRRDFQAIRAIYAD